MKSIIKKVLVFVVIVSFFVSNATYGVADILRYKDTLRTPAMVNSIMPVGNIPQTAEFIESLKAEKSPEFLKASSAGSIVDIVNLQDKRERVKECNFCDEDIIYFKFYNKLGILLNQFIKGEIPYSSIKQYLHNYPKDEKIRERIMPTLIRLGLENGDAYLGLKKKGLAGDYKLIFVGAGNYCPMPGLEPVEITALVEACKESDSDVEEKKIWEEFLAQIQEKTGYIKTFTFNKSDIGSEDYDQKMSEIFNYIFASDGMYYMKELSSDVKLFFSENTLCVVTGQTIKKFSRLTGEELSFGQPRNIDSVEVNSIEELLKYVFIPESTHTYKYLKKNIKKETRILAPFGTRNFYFAKIGGKFKMYDMIKEAEYTFSSKWDVFDFVKRGNNLYIAGIDKGSTTLKKLDIRTRQVSDIVDFEKTPFPDILKTASISNTLKIDREIIITKHDAEGDLETWHYNLKKPLLKRYLPFFKFSSAGISFTDKNLMQSARNELEKARAALLPKAQELLDFLDGKSCKCKIGVSNFNKEDNYNPLILAVGSPSTEAFVEAAKQWKRYCKEWGVKIPVVASTGRGRGVIPFIENTQYYYDVTNPNPEAAKAFRQLYKEKGDILTEAEVIQFIFECSGNVPSDCIFLETESNNTYYNIEASHDVIMNEVMPEQGWDKEKPLKILVVADAFHRLRALLVAVSVFKQGSSTEKRKHPNWQVTAVPFYQPELKDMDDDKLYGIGKRLGYLKQWIGDPYKPAYKENGKPEMHGEIRRYWDFGLIEFEEPEYKDFRETLKKIWTSEKNKHSKQQEHLRTVLLKNYIEAKARFDILASTKTSSSGTYKGLLFDPGYIISDRDKVLYESVTITARTSEEVRVLLQQAKDRGIPLQITAHLRGVDGPGSSLDIPEFQRSLTKLGAKAISEITSTPTIASKFSVTVRFEPASSPDVIEYIAPDYGITEDSPYVIRGGVNLTKEGKTPNGQKDAPAYIFANLFGLTGVKITCEKISPMVLAGGMESSSAFTAALFAAASMFSGANWTLADIFSKAVEIENNELAGLTGGQGHLSAMLGGAYRHVWLSGIKDADGNLINHYGAFSIPFLLPEDYTFIESRMALAQAGKEYKNGKAVKGRTAALINNMWTDLLREKDVVGVKLHSEKLSLAAQYIEALKSKDMKAVVETVNRYVDIRDTLCKRWAECVLEEGKRKWLDRLEPDDKETIALYGLDNDSRNLTLALIKAEIDKKQYDIENLNKSALRNLDRLSAQGISLYSDTAKELIKAARKEGIAIMPLGAGGPAANLVVISSSDDRGHLEKFFASQEMPLLNDGSVKSIIHGTGVLRGYMPFEIGREPIQFNGFSELGLQVPALPVSVEYSETEGVFKMPKSSSAGISLPIEEIVRIDLAAEIANISDARGTIVYNDTALSLKQQQMFESLIGIGTQGLAELEAKLGCNVRLMSQSGMQGGIQDNANTIIISTKKLKHFKYTKYFITEQVQIDTSYVAVAPLIAIAKGLLGLENITEQPKLYAALKKSIERLSRGLLNEKDIETAITAYINGNPMFIKLPLPTSYDYDQLEQLQRQAIMRLINA